MAVKLIGIISFLMIISCTESTNQSEKIVTNDSIQKKLSDKKDSLETIVVIDTFLFKELPLGYADLFAFKFPKRWESGTAENDGDNNPKNSDYGNANDNFLYNKGQYYYSENYFSLPSYSNIIDTSLVGKDSTGLRIVKNIKFRLPDFKQYKVYFSYMLQPYNDVYVGEYGNLILYDRKTKDIRFVPIYLFEAKFEYCAQQYFYIDKDYTIRLRSFSWDEPYIYMNAKSISLEQLERGWR
ncbi:hypothetical protein [Cytophaga aurantiaca]|uniref:hypothetical protein n=1 Tax=Cytophaga aurantiaca TaxID=29530 RepID=UPI000378A3D9|nr:hypothetical protein [Cytophaga aurantiaca]